MTKKKLYLRKKQTQVNRWKAEKDILKEKASGAITDVHRELLTQIETLESRIEDGKAALVVIADQKEDAWESFLEVGVTTWDAVRSVFGGLTARLKR